MSSALPALLRDLDLFERAFDYAGRLLCLGRLAREAMDEGYGSQVVRVCRHALAVAAADDDSAACAEAYGRIAELLLRRGHPRHAARAYDRAAECFEVAASPARAIATRIAQSVAEALYDRGAARRRLVELEARLRGEELAERAGLLRQIWLVLADVDLGDGRAEQALLCLDFALRLDGLPGVPADARLQSLRGRALDMVGRRDEALAALAAAAAETPPGIARAVVLERLGLVQLDARQVEAARASLMSAFELAQALGDLERLTRLDLLLASSWVGENDAEVLRHALLAAHRLAGMPAPSALLLGLLREMCDIVPVRGLSQIIESSLPPGVRRLAFSLPSPKSI